MPERILSRCLSQTSGLCKREAAGSSEKRSTLNAEGTDAFAAATTEAYNNGNDTIAIYYDGELISVPSVNAIIENGQAQITGSASYEEADNIASTIRIG